MVHKVQAVIAKEKNAPVSVETIPDPDEALVDILTCGVCPTDVVHDPVGRPETYKQAFYAGSLPAAWSWWASRRRP